MRRLVLACAAACVEPAHVTVSVAQPPRSPTSKTVDACALVERIQRDALSNPKSCTPARSLEHVSRCVRDGNGAWGLVLDPTQSERMAPCSSIVEAADFGMMSPRFAAHALHADARGHATSGPSFAWSTLDDVRAFDYDGDGIAELLVSATLAAEGGLTSYVPSTTPFGAVWHAHDDDDVATYAPSAKIVIRTFSDVDGDGRPDLITRRGVRLETDDGDVTSYALEGPDWAAHAVLGGTFVFDDVAASYAKRSCAGVLVRSSEGLALVRAALCARLNDESPKLIERHYVARCNELARLHEMPSVLRATCRANPHQMAPDTRAMPDELRELLER